MLPWPQVHHPKRVLILAGPNGAGKTTFAREFLIPEAGCPTFVNADLIAEELSPGQPERVAVRAGRLMLEALSGAAGAGKSFAFETTLANRGYARSLRNWQAAGYHVALCFLSLPTVEVAIERVRQRVAQGGHAIPEDVIRRRFAAGKANFDNLYREIANQWAIYDSSDPAPVLLSWGENT